MPLQKLQFRPGINRESTTLANEGGWFESEKIRFRSGSPEKIGGWCSARATNEENYLMQKLLRAGLGTNHVDHCARL